MFPAKYYKPLRAVRKVMFWLYATLERGWSIERASPAIEDTVARLTSLLEPLWTDRDPAGNCVSVHIRTKEYNRGGHYLHAQTRGCQAFQNLHLATGDESYLEKARSLSDYLVAHQEQNGLFLTHRKAGYPQDEGIGTYWAAVTLANMHRLCPDGGYLEAAIRAGEAGRRDLFGEGYGYVHTLGQTFWTPNASAVACLAYKLLYEATSEERYREYVADGLKHAFGYLDSEGMFPYCETRKSIYFSSYHALVAYFALLFRGSEWDEQFSISSVFDKSLSFLENLVREDGSVMEPDAKYGSFVLSTAICAAIYAKLGRRDAVDRLCAFLGTFLTSDGLYLFQKNGRLYSGRLKSFSDYFTASVLEWVSVVLLERKKVV
jgi:hypothetical protein